MISTCCNQHTHSYQPGMARGAGSLVCGIWPCSDSKKSCANSLEQIESAPRNRKGSTRLVGSAFKTDLSAQEDGS